jgi:ectoine hydroxylase-related dioxygenase (phytanoyl-CoA dioxygenase family)
MTADDASDAAAHAARIHEVGYTILRDVVPADLLERVVATVDRLLVDLEVPTGTNAFLGTRTRRIFNLLARDPALAAVPVHAPVLAVAEEVLDPGLLLSSLTAIETHPGQAPQPFHADDGSIPLPRPHVPLTCVAMWALTDFTADNGATRLVPRSQRRDRIPRRGEQPDGVVEAVMPAGSVLVYDGGIWHGGGANASAGRRLGIVSNYCAGWVRHEENQLLALDRAQVAGFPPRLRAMVGYGVYRGLVGHVDQVDPATWFDPDAATDMVWSQLR